MSLMAGNVFSCSLVELIWTSMLMLTNQLRLVYAQSAYELQPAPAVCLISMHRGILFMVSIKSVDDLFCGILLHSSECGCAIRHELQ